MKNLRKRLPLIIITLIAGIMVLLVTPIKETGAASEYITVESFSEYLTKELGLGSVNGSADNGYVNALIDKGIIKEGDFQSYMNYLTRGDAMVLLNRADEFLYGDTSDPNLVQLAIDKRISDISKVKENKREDTAKAYLKGFMKGYSNGNYSINRSMKVSNKITKNGALNCIKMIKNKNLRAKISPDGQLIRTTNLPKYAKYYPYILASFPNSFYDWKFQYETFKRRGTRPDGTYGDWPYVHLVEYASPAEFAKDPYYFDKNITDECIDVWIEKVRTHLQCVFNVDYRTIGDDWVQTIFLTGNQVGDMPQNEETAKIEYQTYINDMKKNQTVVKSSTIAVDRSSIYYFEGQYHIRAYVKYCIVSSKIKYEDKEKLEKESDDYFNDILYSNDFVYFNDFTVGKWRECCFDIEISGNQVNGADLQKWGVCVAYLNEYMYTSAKVN